MKNSANDFIDEMNKVNEAMGMKKIEKNVEFKANTTPVKPILEFEDFMKADIRICEILSVEKVEKKDKLYKFEINTGFDKRIVVSAIAHQISVEELLGKKFPFILNLPPRIISGIESNGMIIMAEGNDSKLYVIGDQNLEPGAIVI